MTRKSKAVTRKPKAEPDIFETLFGTTDREKQAQGVDALARAVTQPVYGLLILQDGRPGKELRVTFVGDRVPLPALRALAVQTAELITQREVQEAAKQKDAKQATPPAQEETHAH